MRTALLFFASLTLVDVSGDALGWSLFHVELSPPLAIAIGLVFLEFAILLPLLALAFFFIWRSRRSSRWSSYDFSLAWHENPYSFSMLDQEPPEPPEPRFLALDGWASFLFRGTEAGATDKAPPALTPRSLIVLGPALSLTVVELTISFPFWLVVNTPMVLFITVVNSMPSLLARLALDADLEETDRAQGSAYWHFQERGWRQLNHSVLKRDRHRCRCCGRRASELRQDESLTCYLDPALGWSREPVRKEWCLTVCSTCRVTSPPSGFSEQPWLVRFGGLI